MEEVMSKCGICGAGEGEMHHRRCIRYVAPGSTARDLKFDAGKPRWGLLMAGLPTALLGVVRVLTFGALKYEAHSWRHVPNGQERYKDALYRHLSAIESGEATDPESGLSHWSHVACNALFLHELELQNQPIEEAQNGAEAAE